MTPSPDKRQRSEQEKPREPAFASLDFSAGGNDAITTLLLSVGLSAGDRESESYRRPNQQRASRQPCAPAEEPLPVCGSGSSDTRRAASPDTLPMAEPTLDSNVASTVRGSIRNPAAGAPATAPDAAQGQRGIVRVVIQRRSPFGLWQSFRIIPESRPPSPGFRKGRTFGFIRIRANG